MTNWEYKFVDVHPPSDQIESEREFAELGKEGWELTAIYTIGESGVSSHTIAVFKKEIVFSFTDNED